VFEVDTNTKHLKDYVQYRLNLTKANESPEEKPKWEISYRATEVMTLFLYLLNLLNFL